MTLMTMTDRERAELLRQVALDLLLDPQKCTSDDILNELDEVIWQARYPYDTDEE